DLRRCDRDGGGVVYASTELPALAPTGRYALWLLSIDGGSPVQLTHDHAVFNGSFAADGRSIIYNRTVAGESHLWELKLDRDAAPVQITFGPHPATHP